MGQAISIDNLLKKQYTRLEFTGVWEEAFGKPVRGGSWFIYGNPSNGKSSFVQQLARYLAELGLRVEYIALEEGIEDTMKAAALRAGWKSAGRRLKIREPLEFCEFAEIVQKPKSADVFIVDSIQYFGEEVRFKQYLDLRRENPKKLFIYISHVKGRQPDGKAAVKVMRDSSLKIWVEGFRAISKGRYIGPKGYYTIWEERAEQYWGERDKQLTIND